MAVGAVVLWTVMGATGADTQPATKPVRVDNCQEMMKHMQALQTRIKEMDEALDKKVADMNTAEGDKKIQAMADVINEMVSQRKAMREMMADMQQKHMAHTAGHIAKGMTPEARHSMGMCPVMRHISGGETATRRAETGPDD